MKEWRDTSLILIGFAYTLHMVEASCGCGFCVVVVVVFSPGEMVFKIVRNFSCKYFEVEKRPSVYILFLGKINIVWAFVSLSILC